MALVAVALLFGWARVARAQTNAASSPSDDGDGKPPSGYIPGDRRILALGLSPYAPQTPALPGGLTVPPGAPAPPDDWTFNFKGFMSASLRVSRNDREAPAPGQSSVTLHTLPRIVDSYGTFSGTNSPQGSWVDLTFEYGNSVVTSHVKVTTWKPAGAVDWTAVGSQNFVDEAYLTYHVSPFEHARIQWTAGAFRNIYGGLAQYSVGQYNAQIVGMPFGIGETLTAQYDFDSDYTLHLEDGFMGRLGKAPAGVVPTADNGGANPAVPSSWVHHLHVGLARRGRIPLVIGLHYLTNWAQDERDQVDDPRTVGVDEARRPDPRMDVYGFDLRMIDHWLGNFAVAASYADARYATLLTGLNYFGSYTGEYLTKRFLGAAAGGTGKIAVAGLEYTLAWQRFLRHPQPSNPESADLTTSVFADFVSLQTADPETNGRHMVKLGAEVTYRFAPWIALSGRADYVEPNSYDQQESFTVLSPKLILKSAWLSHEQVTLAYSRWFYGQHTHAEFPDNYTRGQLDNEMYSLTFGMWF